MRLQRKITLLLLLFISCGYAQINESIDWDGVVKDETFSHSVKTYLKVEGANYNLSESVLPEVTLTTKANNLISVTGIENYSLETESLSSVEKNIVSIESNSITNKPDFKLTSQLVDGKTVVRLSFVPFIRENGEIKKITNVKVDYNSISKTNSRASWKSTSILSGGNWYKVAVAKGGIVKLNYDFFKRLGFTPEVTDLSRLVVYLNQGGMLPEINTIDPVDDLVQIPVFTKGADDQKIDKDDYALFYVPGADNIEFDGSVFKSTKNIYSDSSYCFISFNGGDSKPLGNEPSSNGGTVISVFDDFGVHEIESSNLLSSGRLWFGEKFSSTLSYSIDLDFPNILSTQNATVKVYAALRSLNSVSTLTASAGSIGSSSIIGGKVSGDYTADFAEYASTEITGRPSKSKVSVFLNFTKGGGESEAWLDKIEINCKRNLTFVGPQLPFRNVSTFGNANSFTYEIANPTSGMQVWNISNPLQPRLIGYNVVNAKARFNVGPTEKSEFVAFDPKSIAVPTEAYQIENQNLHSLGDVDFDYLIISPEMFRAQAEELAEIHKEYGGLQTSIVNVKDIYNEFGAGRQDLVAIRNFIRFLKETSNGGPKYVLLFGDASYDFKNRITGNTNFIPIYQTLNSLRPTSSIATDDFIAYLSPDYVGPITAGIMEVGVGRFPVKTVRQATEAVDKVRAYYGEAAFGSWRNRLTFIADDEDGNIHMEQVDNLSTQVDTNFPFYNVNKVLSDAYPQRATPGGHRYPDVNAAIDNAVLRGSLTMNYLGHGGELGWAHERILEVSQINSWDNRKNMPLLITATCEFSRFDDPKRTSAGEFVFLNPDGGGIGLLTTTRLVFSTPNFALATLFNKVAYEEYNGEMPRLGDLVRLTKEGQTSLNSRVFALLGDPAIRLAYPKEKVVTTSVPDTIRALDLVTISGEVRSRKTNDLLTDFNGVVYPTVFDKEKNLKTLNNDGKSGSMEFKARTSVLFRGKATVKAGKFTFSFVVPKDIDFSYGTGKISYYAENGVIDGNGVDNDIIVGGKNPNAASDNLGPQIDLYMNDSTFVNGGMTDESPNIYAKFFDNNGINTTGSGVGHDITATLDANTADQIVLNEYYETELNSYQRGVVTYPLSELSEGNHTLQLKAWDVYNNSSTSDIAFVVTSSEELALDHVLNYPNPFTTNTDFYLEHNHPNQDLFVRIQVFTISGKVVKTIDGTYNSKGFRLGPINWNGLDDFGDKIGKGVYVYKVYVKSQNGDIADKFEKLVILH